MIDLGFGLQQQIDYIPCIEAPKKIAWPVGNKPRESIHVCRSKYIMALSNNSCSYFNIDGLPEEHMLAMLEQFAFGIERGLIAVLATQKIMQKSATNKAAFNRRVTV